MRNISNQIISGITKVINQNKEKIVLKRYPLTTDPITGEQISDQSAEKVSIPIYARIAHEKAGVPINTEKSSGLSTNLSRFIITDLSFCPQEQDTFDYKNKSYEVGPVDPIEIFNTIVGYQASLTEA